ncbi:MAG TPA: helix-turn-helix domain-containing protein [Acidimicrobiales bacterium]|nr:helix-turn-helix domain-containing protein [Acidimicrobiales bacterium]
MSGRLAGEVLRHSRAPWDEKSILLALAVHVFDKDGYTTVTVEELAKETGRSERTVTRLTSKLIDRGELTRELHGAPYLNRPKRWRPNLWRVILDTSSGPIRGDTGDTPSEVTGTDVVTEWGDTGDTPSEVLPVTEWGDTGDTPIKKTVLHGTNTSTADEPAEAVSHREIFEALVEVCGANVAEMTKGEGGRYGKAAKELLAAGATPDEVKHRSAEAARRWRSTTSLTPTALVTHWSSLATSSSNGNGSNVSTAKPSPLDGTVAASRQSAEENDRRRDAERNSDEAVLTAIPPDWRETLKVAP